MPSARRLLDAIAILPSRTSGHLTMRLRHLTVAAAVLLTGCSRPAARAPEAVTTQPPPNVVLILLDTLRAENLSTYGYERETSPELTRFAAGSYLFEDVRSQASCTYPSANSILTGLTATRFLGQPDGRMGIPEGVPSLAEILSGRGYTTVAVSASPIVRATRTKFNEHGGFDRGFDVFEERCLWKDAGCVNRRVVDYLKVLREPFFVYAHFMDPHDPYSPPELHFADAGFEGREFVVRGDPNPVADMLYHPKRGGELDLTDAELAHLRDLYDDEIRFLDGRLGALFDRLESSGVLERTMVVVVADHGVEFLEHRHIKHCHTLYDTEIRTPLVIRLPGQREGRRITRQVGNLNLVPTILDYLGIDPAPYELDAGSLRPLLDTGDPAVDLVYSGWGKRRAVKRDRYKLIYDLKAERFELYDLEADPGERVDVVDEHPEVVRDLKRALYLWLEATENTDQSLANAEAAEKKLRAVGYMQ